jgi:hypothetical protein
MTLEEALAALRQYEDGLKAEGFASMKEFVGAYQSACAERDKAASARDKFKEAADKHQETIRSKSGEIGSLKQQIVDMEERLREGEANLAPAAPATPATPTAPAAPAVSPEVELAQVEEALTDAQKAAADALLAQMDDETAIEYTSNVGTRLELLKGLKSDPALKQVARPKSFFKAGKETPAEPKENAYEAILKRVGKVVPGPGGSVAVSRKPEPTQREAPGWLKNS